MDLAMCFKVMEKREKKDARNFLCASNSISLYSDYRTKQVFVVGTTWEGIMQSDLYTVLKWDVGQRPVSTVKLDFVM